MRRIFLLFAITAALCSRITSAQDSVTIRSDPRDLSRPISTLLRQLRDREKISVTYEDPRYSNSSDVEDVTSAVAKNLSPAEEKLRPRILVPRGKAITFVYSPRDLRTPDGVEVTITRMLREYKALGGATFALVRDGLRFHVVPAEVLNSAGESVHQGSILDTVVSVPEARANAAQLLDDICTQVGRQTGYRMDIGPGAINMHDAVREQGIGEQSVRAAFEQIWDSVTAPGSFVWNLYYDPSDKSYGLNFSYVGYAGPVPK
jgi:hypothetical protein